VSKQKIFNYTWENGKDNLIELNKLLESGAYSVGAVFDCTNNTVEQGRFVFVLNRAECEDDENDNSYENDTWST
jgi:hypothetical protein